MRNYFPGILLIIVFSISTIPYSYSQIIDLGKKDPYKKVFVDTDNFGASYLDTLEAALSKVKNDTLQFEILNDLGYYWHTRNLTKAMLFTKRGLQLTAAKYNKLWNGRFQITQGAILLRMEKLDSAYIVLQKAKPKVRENDLAFLNTQLGYIFERRGELDTAANYALESLRLGTKLNDKKAVALAYSDLSNLFWKQSKFENGLEYGLKSVAVFEERNISDLDYDFTLYVVGNNYLSLKKYNEALNYYHHSIAIGERYGFYNNLSDVYISLAGLYAYLDKFSKAEEAGKNAIKYAALIDNNFMMMRSWLSVGKIQNMEGEYASSIESIKRCLSIATDKFGDNFALSEAYQTLGKAYAGNQNYKEAYGAFNEYDLLKDKVFTAASDHRISLLHTEFDVAGKESTIKVQEKELATERTKKIYISIIASLLFLFLIVLYRNFQINRKKNKLLSKQNLEKEFLLKEIHHRVKNNLEIISSLLALQSAQVNDPDIAEAIQESQNRVHSMSLIHQKLYLGKNLSSIEMKDYFINLSRHVLDSFGADERISLEYALDPIELDVDTAIPLGLIVNELLTNALKYAFPGDRKGNIKIGLRQTGSDNAIALEVADNGIGQFENEAIKGTGFGTQLIQLLTRQLDGKMKNKFEGGTKVSFVFNVGKAA